MNQARTLGDRVREARRRRGLTQRDLARLSGLSLSLVRKLEQDERGDIRIETAHKLAASLGVRTTTLIGDRHLPALSPASRRSPGSRPPSASPVSQTKAARLSDLNSLPTRSYLTVAQGDVVGLAYDAGIDGPQPFAEALTRLPQQHQRVGRGTLRCRTLRIGPVLLDEVRLKGRGDLVGRHEPLVNGLLPR